jgi:PAS domain S-box-containing protein
MPVTLPQTVRVLHVDDEPDIAELTATVLERDDDRFSVATATSASEGLDHIDNDPPDCVVSDYDMPGMDGIEFLRAVREQFPDLPFILYTGRGSEAVASDAVSAGVTDYLRKRSGSEQYELLANRIRHAVRARHESERATRQEELRRLTEFAGDTGGFEINYETGEILMTDGTRRLTGLPDGTDSSLSDVLALHPPKEREQVQRAVDRAAETGELTTGTYRLDPVDGERRLVEITIVPTDDATVLRGAVNDVTDRTRRQRELEQIETEKRTRERELDAERRFVDQALDTLDDLFYVLDTDGRLQRWNERFATVSGYGESELDRSRVVDLFPEDEQETITDAVETVLAGERTTVEADICTADGTRLPHEFTGAPLTDADGTITGLVGVGRDLSERRRQERRFQALVEESNDILTIVDAEGRYQYQSPSLERILGYERGETIGDEVWGYIHPEDRETVRETFAEWVSDPERTGVIEYRARAADGTWRWMEARGNNQLDNPAVEGYVVNSRNITEQKQREQELRTLKTQYQTLLDNFPDGAVYLVDEDMRFVRARGEELQHVGLSPEDVEGKTVHDLFPAELADEHEHYFREALAGDATTYEQEYEGSHYRIRTVPVRTNDVEYAMSVSENVTEQVRRRQQLEQQNERLEEFASIVSHDLRNPLQVIRGRLTLASDECDSQHLDSALDALERSEALVDDLLTLAREGEHVDDPEAVGLDGLAEQAWQTVETDAATLELATDRTVRADRSRLRQLFENLFANSVEHGGRNVTVRVTDLSDGFAVADSGTGIPETERDTVFDAGYSTSHDGTGFGLRIVEQVATSHGWTVDLTESVDGGARFEFTGVDTAG